MKCEIVSTQITGLRRCDEPDCEIFYQWNAETADQCEAFLDAILRTHKRLWHPR